MSRQPNIPGHLPSGQERGRRAKRMPSGQVVRPDKMLCRFNTHPTIERPPLLCAAAHSNTNVLKGKPQKPSCDLDRTPPRCENSSLAVGGQNTRIKNSKFCFCMNTMPKAGTLTFVVLLLLNVPCGVHESTDCIPKEN